MLMKCDDCNYLWKARVVNPRQCPECWSYKISEQDILRTEIKTQNGQFNIHSELCKRFALGQKLQDIVIELNLDPKTVTAEFNAWIDLVNLQAQYNSRADDEKEELKCDRKSEHNNENLREKVGRVLSNRAENKNGGYR